MWLIFLCQHKITVIPILITGLTMEIKTRIDAAKRGLKRYYTGKHVSTDMTVNAGFTTDTVLSAP